MCEKNSRTEPGQEFRPAWYHADAFCDLKVKPLGTIVFIGDTMSYN